MKNKVYCAFQFMNEYELLALKLEELWDVVDFFVISEGLTTHTGITKPLNFLANEHIFEKYQEKIIYQSISNARSDHEEPKFSITNERHDRIVEGIKRTAPWDYCVDYYSRDIFEKESLIVPLLDRCEENDIVILGDCDEIPRASVLNGLIENFDPEQIYHLYHRNYWYYMNLEKTDEKWYGNMVLSYKKYLENSFCDMRQNKKGVFVPEAGWHFSYSPVSRINYKTKAITHQDLAGRLTEDTIKNRIVNAINVNQDIYGRPARFEKVNIDYQSHPKFLVDNLEIYKEFILE